MDRKELITIINELFKKGNSFEVRLIGEKNDQVDYNQYDVATFMNKSNYYMERLLLKIKEGVKSGLFELNLANSVIESIKTKGYFQEGTFSSLRGMQYESRLYLNPAFSDSYYEFIEEFVLRGLKSGLHFEMKSANSLDGDTRDGIVIYTIEKDLEEVTNICLAIFREHPEFGKHFGSPPYGSVRPNPYFGVCQGITKKFRTDTYNSFFNHIACQSFAYLMLEKYPEIRKQLSLKIGKDLVDNFMEYKLNYSLVGIATDRVSSTFMSSQTLLNQAYDRCCSTGVGDLSLEFYEQLKKFASLHMYGDLEHLMHPAITENTRFLEIYLKDKVNEKEKNKEISNDVKKAKESDDKIKFNFNSEKQYEFDYDYFYVPGDLNVDLKGRGGR